MSFDYSSWQTYWRSGKDRQLYNPLWIYSFIRSSEVDSTERGKRKEGTQWFLRTKYSKLHYWFFFFHTDCRIIQPLHRRHKCSLIKNYYAEMEYNFQLNDTVVVSDVQVRTDDHRYNCNIIILVHKSAKSNPMCVSVCMCVWEGRWGAVRVVCVILIHLPTNSYQSTILALLLLLLLLILFE